VCLCTHPYVPSEADACERLSTPQGDKITYLHVALPWVCVCVCVFVCVCERERERERELCVCVCVCDEVTHLHVAVVCERVCVRAREVARLHVALACQRF
jgi:hypothetical protein